MADEEKNIDPEQTELMEGPKESAPKLVVKDGGNVILEYEITKEKVTIGRKQENDIVLDSLRVSRRHAQIVEENGRYYLEPLSETNPTFLNYENAPLHGKRPLQSGDRIRLGGSNIVLTFTLQ